MCATKFLSIFANCCPLWVAIRLFIASWILTVTCHTFAIKRERLQSPMLAPVTCTICDKFIAVISSFVDTMEGILKKSPLSYAQASFCIYSSSFYIQSNIQKCAWMTQWSKNAQKLKICVKGQDSFMFFLFCFLPSSWDPQEIVLNFVSLFITYCCWICTLV